MRWFHEFAVEQNNKKLTIKTPHSNKRIKTVFYRKKYKDKEWVKIIATVKHLQMATDELNEYEPLIKASIENMPTTTPEVEPKQIVIDPPKLSFLDRLFKPFKK